MIDEFLWKYKWLIGGVLIVAIIAGGSLIWRDSAQRTKKTQENQEILSQNGEFGREEFIVFLKK